ncbi:hypothetical protein AAVH_41547, partial [Aphelenchoides avenae]
TTSPIVCILLPTLASTIPGLLGTRRLSAEVKMFGYAIVAFCFPLINSVLTVTFVKPYREASVRLVAQCFGAVKPTSGWVRVDPRRQALVSSGRLDDQNSSNISTIL